MTDDRAIYRAILAEPDEDTHRLVYADWLDENGDGAYRLWAAVIRYQVARPYELLTIGPHHPGWKAWRFAGYVWPKGTDPAALLAATERIAPAADFRRDAEFVTVKRGFVDFVETAAGAWAERGPLLAGRYPFTRVTLSDRHPRPTPSGYGWVRGPDAPAFGPAEEIPGPIWDRLRAFRFAHDNVRVYGPDDLPARWALQLAAVDWARAENGLGALPTPEWLPPWPGEPESKPTEV